MSQQTSNQSFDELASGLARGTLSRGKALRLMGAALVGGTLGSLGIREAAADEICKAEGKKCRRNEQCCSENCSKSGTSRFGTCAPACLPDLNIPGDVPSSPCTSDAECCSGNCLSVFDRGQNCVGRNSVRCQCENSGGVSACSSVDCSDATARDQFCNQQCVAIFGAPGVPGSNTCLTEGCVRAL